MPRKKQTTTRRSRAVKKTTKSTRKTTPIHWADKWMQSYSSFLLGVVVVIVAVLFGASIIRQQNHTQQTSSLSTGPTPTVTQATPTPGATVSENGQTYYIVKQNDSLWTIALAVYNDGYKWVDIAKANNLVNPGTIFTGDKLLVPNAPTPSELGQLMGSKPTPTPSDAITTKTYTVQKGDSLWNIAIRAYADGYQWTKIAQANNLANPDLIFSGNVLQIPR